MDFLVSDPNTVVLGNARAESMYCWLMLIFFTVMAGLLYYMLAHESSFRKELRGAISREMKPLPKGKTLLFIAPFWLLACGWFYNATLGGKYFELRKEGTGEQTVFTFVYRYPYREKRVPASEVEQWGGYIVWKRRTVKHSLIARFEDDHKILSSGLHPAAFRLQAETLRKWGIDIVTEPTDEEGSAFDNQPGR